MVIAIALVAALATGCGSDTKVGSGVDLNLKDAAGDTRLGERTTTTATTAPGQALGVGQNTTTTRPPPTTAPAGFEIAINSDNASQSQFHPSQARVFVGTTVRWVNRDVQPRSVVADGGAFESPSLVPGQAYVYTANTPGRFDYHDGTRPYAVASLEVVAR